MDFDLEQLKIGFQLLKESLGLAKAVKDILPNSPQKEAADKSLIAAEKAVEIAEANIAKAFNFPLCQCTFPPGIMTMLSSGSHQDLYKCPKCKKEYLVRGKRTGKIFITGVPSTPERDQNQQ
jgi:hypothetical protein